MSNRYFVKALNESINIRFIDDDRVGISLDETTSKNDVLKLLSVFGIEIKYENIVKKLENVDIGILKEKARTSSY